MAKRTAATLGKEALEAFLKLVRERSAEKKKGVRVVPRPEFYRGQKVPTTMTDEGKVGDWRHTVADPPIESSLLESEGLIPSIIRTPGGLPANRTYASQRRALGRPISGGGPLSADVDPATGKADLGVTLSRILANPIKKLQPRMRPIHNPETGKVIGRKQEGHEIPGYSPTSAPTGRVDLATGTRNLARGMTVGGPRPRGPAPETLKGGGERLGHFPAMAKHAIDDDTHLKDIQLAAAHWWKEDGLPEAMRVHVRAAMDVGTDMVHGDKAVTKKMAKIFRTASKLERDLAQRDMNTALYRQSTDAGFKAKKSTVKRLQLSSEKREAVDGTYILANRIRAMQDVLEIAGHGGQRGLHNISGMIFRRAQRLGEALTLTDNPNLFRRELMEWEGLQKFMDEFGPQVLGLAAAVNLGRGLFGKNPPDPEGILSNA